MAIERYGSKTDVVVKLVLVFFVCLLSFSVGTFVGKKFSDNQHRLAQFEPTSTERQVAATEEHGATTAATGELNDDEMAKIAAEFTSDDEGESAAKGGEHAATAKTDQHGVAGADQHGTAKPDQHGIATATETHGEVAKPAEKHAERTVAATQPAIPAEHAPAKAEAKHETASEPKIELKVDHKVEHKAEVKAEKPSAAAESVAHGQAPKTAEKTVAAPHAAAPAKSAIPTTLPQEVAASAIGKFTVQVASYPTQEEATRMTNTLKGEGFGAFFIKADVIDKKTAATKTWYRVSVGLFQTQKEADAYKADLLARSKVTSAIVQKVTQ